MLAESISRLEDAARTGAEFENVIERNFFRIGKLKYCSWLYLTKGLLNDSARRIFEGFFRLFFGF